MRSDSPRLVSRSRSRRRLAVLAFLACLPPVVAGAPAPAQGPDLNMLVLDWARGRYASPVHCEIDGQPLRGLRRLLIAPGSPDARPPVDRIIFVKLEVENATRCFTALASAVPNIRGQVQIRLPGASHPETALRDFNATLRRKNGFEFDIPEGFLLLQDVGPGSADERRFDLRGGRARLSMVEPGTDAARVLADLPDGRRVLLELETRDGEKLSLPLVRTSDR